MECCYCRNQAIIRSRIRARMRVRMWFIWGSAAVCFLCQHSLSCTSNPVPNILPLHSLAGELGFIPALPVDPDWSAGGGVDGIDGFRGPWRAGQQGLVRPTGRLGLPAGCRVAVWAAAGAAGVLGPGRCPVPHRPLHPGAGSALQVRQGPSGELMGVQWMS